MTSSVGVKFTVRKEASYVLVPATESKSASPFAPVVSVLVPDEVLDYHQLDEVKLLALPVDKMTPVSPGVTFPATESPFE